MHKFALISKYGDFLPIALRMAKRGDDIRVYIHDRHHKQMYDGILPKQHTPDSFFESGRYVIYDMSGFGKAADRAIQRGHPVFGAASLADWLELDRAGAIKLCEEVGIKVPRAKKFWSSDVDGMKAYVRKVKRRLVLKPCNNASTDLTYVSSSWEDMLRELDIIRTLLPQQRMPVVLEDFVGGVELSFEGWWDGKQFLRPFNCTFEEKKFMNGGLGPNTGCAGNVVMTVPSTTPRIYEATLQRIEPILAASRYVGPVDVNTILDEHGDIYFLEFTPRFGYDAIQTINELLDEPISNLIYDMLNGTAHRFPLSTSDFAVGVRLSTPPYPFAGKPKQHRIGLPHRAPAQIYLSDAMRIGKEYYVSGADGNVLTAVARSPSIERAAQAVYTTLDAVEVANKQYRTDVHNRAIEQLPLLAF